MRDLRRLVGVIVLAAVMGGAGGCKKAEPTDAELASRANQARSAAAAAFEAGDVPVARQTAEEAGQVHALAEARIAKAEAAASAAAPGGSAARAAAATDANRALLDEAKVKSEEAVNFLPLTVEAAALNERLDSWKLRSYRAARGSALKLTFSGLALAVDREAAKGFAALSAEEQAVVSWIELMTGLKRLEGGEPDWKAIRTRLDSYGNNPPPIVNFLLAASFLAMAQNDMALLEAEAIRPTEQSDPLVRAGCYFLRGLAFRWNGYSRLAVREFEAVAGADCQAAGVDGTAARGAGGQGVTNAGDQDAVSPYGPELQGIAHLCLAMCGAADRDWPRMEREMLHVNRIWPDHPVSELLTSELLVSQGQYEKAATVLEGLRSKAVVQNDEWLMAQIERRAREIRERQGATPALFQDGGLMRELALHYVGVIARQAQDGQKLQGYLDAARRLGNECLKYLPNGGGTGPNSATSAASGTSSGAASAMPAEATDIPVPAAAPATTGAAPAAGQDN